MCHKYVINIIILQAIYVTIKHLCIIELYDFAAGFDNIFKYIIKIEPIDGDNKQTNGSE